LCWLALPAFTEPYRIATYAAPLSRDGPGLLLRDIDKGEDPQIAAIIAVIRQTAPDILLLTDFDYDYGGAALAAFSRAIADAGHPMPYVFARLPNTGLATGLDHDGDGRLGDARDNQGYGRFAGDGGMAVLSRFPIDTDGVRNFSDLLWRDIPGATLPPMADQVRAVQRLSETAHWVVPIRPANGPPITLLAYSATAPVFDGPEDRNGLRNRDETRFWMQFLDGTWGPPPEGRFAIIGNANLDPVDGEGFRDTMSELLNDPRVQDPKPASLGAVAAADPAHRGDPALDTVDWRSDGPGNLRVSYVIPSADWQIIGAGVYWPAPGDESLLGSDGLAAGAHRLVWVDVGG